MPLKIRNAKSHQAIVVVSLGLLLTIITTSYIYWAEHRGHSSRFQAEVISIENMIKDRISRYEGALLQVRAFMLSHPSVDRKTFHNYINRTAIIQRYPGVQGLGYTVKIDAKDLKAHERKIKSEDIKYYKVWPEYARDEYFSILYIEPMDWRNQRAIGFDMFTEPVRRAAMARARDTGTLVLSGKVKLVQETKLDTQPGFLLYLPVFKPDRNNDTIEERRSNLIGFVYSPFRANDLFRTIFRNDFPLIDFEIYEGTEHTDETLLYNHSNIQFIENGNRRSKSNDLFEQKQFVIAGHTFSIVATAKPGFIAPFSKYSPAIAGLLGLIFTSLLWWNVISAKYQAGKVRAADQRLRQLADAIPQLAWIALPDGYMEWYNKRWYEYTGTTLEEMKGWGWRKVHHPDHVQKVLDFVQEAWKKPEPWELTFPLKSASGEWRWFLTRAVPLTGSSGEIVQWFGTNTDITDQFLVAEERKIRQAEFERNVDGSPAILWITDKDGPCTYLSKQWYTFTGQTPEEALGFGWIDVIHPNDRERVENVFRESNSKQQPFSIEYRLRTKSNDYRWAIGAGNPRRDNEGNYLGYAGTVFDIHERRELESKLQAQLNLTKTITDNAASCLFMMDNKGYPTFMNPAAEKLTGYRLDEIKDRPLHYALHYKRPDGSDYPIEECPIDNAHLELRALQNQEETFVDKAGRLYPVSYSVAPLRGNGGTVGSVLEFRDISEQKRAQQDLVAAKEQAESANRLKSAFLANMSHEIRTPLGVMVGFADLISDPSLGPEERRQYATTLKRNGEMLTSLVNDILDLSKVEAGQLKLERITFALPSVVEDVFAALRVKASEKGIDLKMISPEKTPTFVTSDPVRFKQILWNLLGNAIKFTEKGQVLLRLMNVKEFIEMEIEDTGIGIADKDQEKLFKPFTQTDISMTRKYGGTGLGLALSKRLCELLGGKLELKHSEIGVGSTFKFSIRNYISKDSQMNRNVTAKSTFEVKTDAEQQIQPRVSNELKGVNVLVIDDSTDNQQLISHLLSKKGATVEVAGDGQQAIEMALRGRYDILIMDIQMPVMDGYAATQRLRELGYRKPIIALTAHAMSEVRQKCFDVGCTDWAAKPVNSHDLLLKILKHVKKVDLDKSSELI